MKRNNEFPIVLIWNFVRIGELTVRPFFYQNCACVYFNYMYLACLKAFYNAHVFVDDPGLLGDNGSERTVVGINNSLLNKWKIPITYTFFSWKSSITRFLYTHLSLCENYWWVSYCPYTSYCQEWRFSYRPYLQPRNLPHYIYT